MSLSILPPRLPSQRVTIDGFAVPHVEVHEITATGQWQVIYDERWEVVAESIEELDRWLRIVANAQAVGEGYSCHGENSIYRPNPHKVRVTEIGSVK